MSTVSTNVSAICKFDASTFICGNHEGVIFTFNTETKETRQLLKLKTMASIEKIVVEDTSIGVISDGEAYLFDLNNLIAGAKKIEAFLAISKINKNLVLVTDEHSGKRLIELINDQQKMVK